MSKELFVRREDNAKRVMYLIKELLKDNKDISVVASHIGAGVVARVCNSLSNMNYVTISNVQTNTQIVEERRKITFRVLLTKTQEFEKLYLEN